MPFLSEVIIRGNIFLIWCAKHFKHLHIVRFQFDLNIVRWREESPIKVLKQVPFQIIILNSTKIIEPFDFCQWLTDIWSKLFWDPNNCCVNILLTYFIDEIICSWNRVITNISQHDQSILTLLFWFWIKKYLIEYSKTCLESRRKSCSSASLNRIN